MEDKKLSRCWNTDNPLYISYHDEEWGVPIHEETKLFEFLILEGFQAGLSWELILKRRDDMRQAFSNFDPIKVAKYTEKDVKRLMNNPKVIRNLRKIEATILNAKKFIEVQEEFGSFDKYIWSFVDGKPIKNSFKDFSEMPSKTPLSEKISKDLKKRGFKFVGPVICYSFMQAIGMVNDHLIDCFRYDEVGKIE